MFKERLSTSCKVVPVLWYGGALKTRNVIFKLAVKLFTTFKIINQKVMTIFSHIWNKLNHQIGFFKLSKVERSFITNNFEKWLFTRGWDTKIAGRNLVFELSNNITRLWNCSILFLSSLKKPILILDYACHFRWLF